MTISYVASAGGRLALEVEGSGPLVICSPAMGDTRDAFRPLSAHLVASGFRVACVDLRGHGDSEFAFDRYGDEATADDLLAVVQALGGGPAILAGASMSAAAAVIAAARSPDDVAGLVLLAPFLRNGSGRMMRWMLHVALARPWGPTIWRFYAAKLWPGLGEKAKERAAITTSSLMRPGRWAAFRATTETNHDVVAPWLKRVQAPVLVVIGAADPDWHDPLAEADWVASNFTDSEIIAVQGAGHAPMIERPEIVNRAVSDFLQRIGTVGASVSSNDQGRS